MKRVLIISYYWPPAGGSGVQRWVKFAKYFPALGWQPVIYTPDNPEMIAKDDALGADVPPEAEVIRRKIVEPYGIYRSLFGRKGGGTSEVNPIHGGKKSLAARLSLFVRANAFIPDPRCLWIRPSVRFLKQYLQAHPVDAIVSTGPPQSMHLIARGVARATGIPWVADFRDAWTKMFYYKHLPLTRWADALHRRQERSVLDEATRVVSVSPREQRDFQAMTRNTVFLLTNGYDPDDYAATFTPDGCFNVTHTGLFAADGNSEALWRVLAAKKAADPAFAQALRIRFSGKTDAAVFASIRASGLGDCLVDNGYCSHPAAVAEQRGASVLLISLRREPEYASALPGKVFEYLASRRPVLGVGQPDSVMAEVVRGAGAGEVFDWEDEAGIRTFIDGVWERFRNGCSLDNPQDISRFSRKELARKYVELLEGMV